uniref:GRIP domain-containing protein n=1 Tax=Ascaris lumbricoides TaxID=6252 RepID=A0A0M3HKY1_ASCLU
MGKRGINLKEKVVVSLNEEENTSMHGNSAASKLAAVEREIAELNEYYLNLQCEQKQWDELLEEKQRDVENASRDNGPKELSSHRFARMRRSYLEDLGALHTVEGSIANFVRKVGKNFPKVSDVLLGLLG